VTARTVKRLRRVAPRSFRGLAAVCLTLLKDLFDPYRPEQHYMRGPGPKCREKRARAALVPAHAGGRIAPGAVWSAR
jgi:hypothetical protein